VISHETQQVFSHSLRIVYSYTIISLPVLRRSVNHAWLTWSNRSAGCISFHVIWARWRSVSDTCIMVCTESLFVLRQNLLLLTACCSALKLIRFIQATYYTVTSYIFLCVYYCLWIHVCVFSCFRFFLFCRISFSTLILLVGSVTLSPVKTVCIKGALALFVLVSFSGYMC